MEIRIHCLLEIQSNITFVDKQFGTVVLSYGKNPLNGNWMYWWEATKADLHSMFAPKSKSVITQIVRNIKKQHKSWEEFILTQQEPIKIIGE